MQGVSTEKIQGGKLLRVKVDYEERINKVQITGDFFAHPEDVIEKIENSLDSIGLDTSETEIQEKVEKVLEESKADIVGIDAAAIARNIIKAVSEKQ